MVLYGWVRVIARTPLFFYSSLARAFQRAREPVRLVSAKLAERRRKHGFRLRLAEGYGGHAVEKEVACGHVLTSHADGVTPDGPKGRECC